MKILALEFSSEQRSAAVIVDVRLRGEAGESGGSSTRALRLVEQALGQAGVNRSDIECIAVGLGPGSYTGIRSAIALAQGWQLATAPQPLKLLGVSSVECLAHEARDAGCRGKINIVIDGQRNELYLAGFEIADDAVREIDPLRLVPLATAQALADRGELLAGPETTRWFAAGKILFPTAARLGRLASQRQDFVSGEQLEPVYLRETSFVKAPLPRVLPDQ